MGIKPTPSHTVNGLKERCTERGRAGQSSLKGRERAIVSQTKVGSISKITFGTLLKDGVECIWTFPSA